MAHACAATKMAAPLAAVFGGACPELSRRVGIDAAESRENCDLLRSAKAIHSPLVTSNLALHSRLNS